MNKKNTTVILLLCLAAVLALALLAYPRLTGGKTEESAQTPAPAAGTAAPTAAPAAETPAPTPEPTPEPAAAPERAAVDYADAANWVTTPETLTHEVDCFFILPTVNLKDTECANEDYTDEKNASRYVKTLAMEGGLVSGTADIYAPFYRQATIACFMGDDGRMPTDWARAEHAEEYLAIAYEDIRDAWLYYLEHWNAGRPVLLFGYSQGADMVLRLLEEFGAQGELPQRLVAAYVIGASVYADTREAYPWLSMAEGETDTGVIVCFNAMDARAGYSGPKELSINPLNWKTDGTLASREENLGYVVTDTHGEITQEIPAYCGACLDESSGKLIVTDCDELDALYAASDAYFHIGDYHLSDLSLFYRNLQKNVADRAESYLSAAAQPDAA